MVKKPWQSGKPDQGFSHQTGKPARPAESGVEIAAGRRYLPAMTDKTDLRPATLLLALLFLLLPPAAGQAHAAEPGKQTAAAASTETRRIGNFQAWDAYEYMNKGTQLCYLHAQPKKTEPGNVRRGEIYILVTHKPKEHIRNEVSIYFGYPLKDAVAAKAVIDGASIDMFTHEEAAWAADSDTDQKLVQALRKGRTLVVKGISTRGTNTTDTYDLTGFTAALQAIDKACNMGASS